MKRLLLTLMALAMMTLSSTAQEAHPKKMMKLFQSVPMTQATLLQEGKAKPFCPECGMMLPMFYKTNHVATLDGKEKQYCSLHCMVADLEHGATLTHKRVVDVTTLKFIPVEEAYYVVGSSKKGTMSMVSKYAFGKEVDAKAFATQYGGDVMRFEGAYGVAKQGFAKESKMIAKKQAMMAKKGAMLYAKKCQATQEKFKTTADAKAFVMSHKLCSGLNPKQMQAVGLYLSRR